MGRRRKVAVTASFTQGSPYGSVVYYARTVGLDGNGNTFYSSVALATAVQIAPKAPTGLSVGIDGAIFWLVWGAWIPE
jgi:hypothetical protein